MSVTIDPIDLASRLVACPSVTPASGEVFDVLDPGGISSQRHWHEGEDEFVVMIEGEAVLVEEDGETAMRAGDCAAFPKGVANGHQLVNRSDRPCTFVAIGRIAMSDCHYPDIDLHLDGKTARFVRKDGSDFETPAEAIR